MKSLLYICIIAIALIVQCAVLTPREPQSCVAWNAGACYCTVLDSQGERVAAFVTECKNVPYSEMRLE